MNNKIAFGLLIGFIFSLIVGFTTSETVETYNATSHKGSRYDGRDRGGVKRTLAKTETVYHTPLIFIAFAGGFGLGFLIFDKIRLTERKDN